MSFIKVFNILCGILLFCNGKEFLIKVFILLEMKIVFNVVKVNKNLRFYFFGKVLSCLVKVLYFKKKNIILSKKL